LPFLKTSRPRIKSDHPLPPSIFMSFTRDDVETLLREQEARFNTRLKACRISAAQNTHDDDLPDNHEDVGTIGISPPWAVSHARGEFTTDERGGYQLPAHLVSLFSRARSDSQPRPTTSRRIARTYPTPAGDCVGETSALDPFLPLNARDKPLKTKVSDAVAAKKELQAKIDLCARTLVGVVDASRQLLRILCPDDCPDLDGEEPISDETKKLWASPSGAKCIIAALKNIESGSRDALRCNRHTASQLETQCRKQVATALDFDKTVIDTLGELPSDDYRHLFGSAVRDRLDEVGDRSQRTAIISLAAASASRSGNAQRAPALPAGRPTTTWQPSRGPPSRGARGRGRGSLLPSSNTNASIGARPPQSSN
jgi:hypothetical protein